MPRYITLIAVITAVAFAIAPEVTTLSPLVGKILTIIAIAGAACGESLIKSQGNVMKSLLALFLVGIILSGAACGEPSRETLTAMAGAGQLIETGIEATRGLPDVLLADGVIDQKTRDQIVTVLAETEPLLKEFNDRMSETLASPKPDLKKLAPLAASIAVKVSPLPVVQNSKWKTAVAGIEIAVRFISNYFSLQVRTARALGLSDKEICRRAGIPYSPQMFVTLEALAEKTDADAARVVERFINERAGA
jgi:hypothetical protein